LPGRRHCRSPQRWQFRQTSPQSRTRDCTARNSTHATIVEIAAAEKINESYVGRVLRPTLLAPDIVEAVLNGRQPPEVTLAVPMQPIAVA
jgi:hypothetical protein